MTINMPKYFFVFLIMLLLLLCIGIADQSAQAETITFEEGVSQQGSIKLQYCNKGVEFLYKGGRIFEPYVGTASPTHALHNDFIGDEFGQNNVLQIRFTAPQSSVSVKVGVDRMTETQYVEASILAFSTDTPGTRVTDFGYITSDEVNLWYPPIVIDEPLTVQSQEGNIRSVTIKFINQYGQPEYEVIDDLTFSTVGPNCSFSDISAPRAFILKPVSNTQTATINNPVINLAFIAEDDVGIAQVRINYFKYNSILKSFFICGGEKTPPCPSSKELSYDFITELPEGTNRVEVEVLDLSGKFNLQGAYITIDMQLPGPDINLWAEAIEITQGVQSWVPVNSESNLPEGNPPTFWYHNADPAVPLVAGRKTVVRLYAGVEGTANDVPAVDATACLRCYNDDTYASWDSCPGPLAVFPENQPDKDVYQKITVDPSDSLDTKRRDIEKSWNFVLPDEWTQAGIVHLEAEVEAPDGTPECDDCEDGANTLRLSNVQFFSVPNLSEELLYVVRLFRIFPDGYLPIAAWPSDEEIKANMNHIQKIYPVDESTVPLSNMGGSLVFRHSPSEIPTSLEVCEKILDLMKSYKSLKSFNQKSLLAIADSEAPLDTNSNTQYGQICAGLADIGDPACGVALGSRPKAGAHETGHTFGLHHPGGIYDASDPSPGHGNECGIEGWCETDWPWGKGTIGDAFGFDILKMRVIPPFSLPGDPMPFEMHDVMSYGKPKWISSRNWIRLFNAFTGEDFYYPKMMSSVASEPTALMASVSAENYLLVRGKFEEATGDWILLPFYELELPQGMSDVYDVGEYKIELRNSQGRLLAEYYFDIETLHVDPEDTENEPALETSPFFSKLLPLPEGVETIIFSYGDTVLAQRSRTGNIPTVGIISPTSDGFQGQPDNPLILWAGGDTDGDPLHYIIQYSSSASDRSELKWDVFALDLTFEELEINLQNLPGSNEAMVRVLATDGFNTNNAVSPAFIVPSKIPGVDIYFPQEETITIQKGKRFVAKGTAFDREDGLLDSESLSWHSNVDALLGVGRQIDFAVLSLGVHDVTLKGEDSDGSIGESTINVEVVASPNSVSVADAGPDQTIERDSLAGALVTLDGSGSYDYDGDTLSYEWSWHRGSASGVSADVVFPMGQKTITLTVSDGKFYVTDTVSVTVVDTTLPTVSIIVPYVNDALQDGVTLTAEASDISGIDSVNFYMREPGGPDGVPIGYENLAGTLNISSNQWEYDLDTTQLPDGYYVVLAKATDTVGNEGWSTLVNFSIRNWAVVELLPSSKRYKAGRTMPIKFSLRIAAAVDPLMPFVYNEELKIKIYKSSNPGSILQTSLFGNTSTDYRIDSLGELYITNFKTDNTPAEYTVEIWRDFMIDSFIFETKKK
ncbi:MAG: hypothetical protein HF978_07235 [Desulfobacteraceae bacterium]|nr:Ig-like domain-containing protein [Desulfobacteraceae bacterium]MBC2755325.1 hypothetical protein [Desulfobacteraceae bacterium]